jgi:hypothetical protein
MIAANRPTHTSRTRRVARRLAQMPGPLLRDPTSARYAPEWTRSLFSGHNPLDDQVPWLPFKARRWLADHVGKETSVFEYGSGGSTLFLARRAGRVISVEHDATWYAHVSRALAGMSVGNCEHMLREPEPATGAGAVAAGPTSGRTEFAGFTFDRYVRSIDDHPDGSLDVVIVDGRARLACVERALPKIRPGGHLVLDNAERPEYAPAFERLAAFPRLDLHGLAPYRTYHWQTTVWHVA